MIEKINYSKKNIIIYIINIKTKKQEKRKRIHKCQNGVRQKESITSEYIIIR